MNDKDIIKTVLSELETMGIIKPRNELFKNTESILYNYKAIKETIGQRKNQINDLKKYGIPKKSKSLCPVSKNNSIRIEDNDLLDVTIKNIEKSIIKTKTLIKYIDSILSKFISDPYYDIIKLKYFEKKSIEEVANALEKDVATISRNKNRLINDLKIYFMPNDVLSDILGFWLRCRAKIVQKVRNWHTDFYIL